MLQSMFAWRIHLHTAHWEVNAPRCSVHDRVLCSMHAPDEKLSRTDFESELPLMCFSLLWEQLVTLESHLQTGGFLLALSHSSALEEIDHFLPTLARSPNAHVFLGDVRELVSVFVYVLLLHPLSSFLLLPGSRIFQSSGNIVRHVCWTPLLSLISSSSGDSAHSL